LSRPRLRGARAAVKSRPQAKTAERLNSVERGRGSCVVDVVSGMNQRAVAATVGPNAELDALMTQANMIAICMRRRVVFITLSTLVSIAASLALAGDPMSDTFQPDVFGTESALQRRITGLTDPLGRECAAPVAALSFPAAVDLALCLNPTTRSAWATARQQAAALGSAESAWLPSLSATGSESRDYGEHVDVTGNLDSSPQNTRDAALNLSWTLYDFGGRGGRITSARRLLDAAAASASSVVQQTVLNVVQTYYGVVASDADVVAAATTESDGLRALEVARALAEGGAGSLADVLQAETAYDQAVLVRVQAEAAAKIAHGTLAVTLGLNADRTLSLDAQPVPAEVPALAARMTDLMEEAQRQRPDLAAALAQRDAAVANVTVARAVGRPSIAISAGRTLSDTTGVPHQNYTLVGVSVTVPVFTGFSVDYGVRQAQGALQVSEANVEQIRLSVSSSVWNAYYSLESADQQLAVTSGLIKTAEKNEEVALGRYQGGVGTIVDVLTAQAAASLARQTRIAAELAWQTARAQLAFALGRLTGAEPLADGAASP
jgi:outer membrane protein